jgi:hypothetical protein
MTNTTIKTANEIYTEMGINNFTMISEFQKAFKSIPPVRNEIDKVMARIEKQKKINSRMVKRNPFTRLEDLEDFSDVKFDYCRDVAVRNMILNSFKSFLKNTYNNPSKYPLISALSEEDKDKFFEKVWKNTWNCYPDYDIDNFCKKFEETSKNYEEVANLFKGENK